MPRTVLLLTEEHGPGGVNTVTGQWQAVLQTQGWVVTTQSVRRNRPGLLNLLNQARHAQVIVASNNFLPAYWAVLLGLLARRPSVVWVHGPLAEVLQARPVSRWRRWLPAWTCRMADALVFASRTSQESLHRVVPERQLQLQSVIHNPAPEPVNTGQATTEKMLGFVGRLSREKRPERLLHMLARLGPEFGLTLVGDGPLRPALEKLAHTLELGDRVHFAGEQPVNADIYRAWQATLLCSAYEGYPMAALESLAAGVPVIGVPLPALQEMLQSQGTNWLAADDSPQALARAVQSALHADPASRREQALSIARRHPVSAFAQAWKDLLLRLSGERPTGPRTVHFVHTGPAYMPELAAYETHLAALGHSSQRHSTAASVPTGADVVWWICGRVNATHAHRLRHSLQVHEYASASVGRWPALKDRLKRWQHPRPDHRVFLNDWVRERMGFADGVPHTLRDMGVPARFFQAERQEAPEFDLVYLGEMSRLLAFGNVLRAIDAAGLRLLLLGDVPLALQALTAPLKGISCPGRVPQNEVPAWLLSARAGLNLMPDRLPVAQQTSTKVLEYLAVGLPVLSNDYAWARRTAARYPERMALLANTALPDDWHKAMAALPAWQADRRHLQALAWPSVMTDLPVWQALGLQAPHHTQEAP
jgi:glycosyltransferase involved in cell wall biosynthesis